MILKSTVCTNGQWLHFLCQAHKQPDSENKVAHVTERRCSVPKCQNRAYSFWFKTQEINVPENKSFDWHV